MNELLAYSAAGLVALWSVAHAVPTRQVVAGFGPSDSGPTWKAKQRN